MLFEVKPVSFRPPSQPRNQVYLIKDNWDDWFTYRTMFTLTYIDANGETLYLGSVKIGETGLEKGRPNIPESFEALNERFFSLGQDVTYYERLNELGDDVRYEILNGLNDIALLPDIYDKVYNENVMYKSLLRDVTSASVKGQYRRLANGDSSLSHYKFRYVPAKLKSNVSEGVEFSFEVTPESNPPTNIHILIGRNGVGKTHLLNNMIHSLVDEHVNPDEVGYFESDVEEKREEFFANLVSVTFSAFDTTEPPAEQTDASKGMRYFCVGLKQPRSEIESSALPKSTAQLLEEFVESAKSCCIGAKSVRWVRAINMLESDPMFKASEVAELAYIKADKKFREKASYLFNRLSSGHKIILLTITRLVETVEERTLVLLDEPEGHLHPPLLSAFTRALSDLLIRRNGVALIATHSPVVLQEVPRSCVSILRRSGSHIAIDRPQLETFGENIGALTREVFGLEVTYSGFHKMLLNAVEEYEDYESVVEHFNGELGMEAKAIIRALLSTKN
ncbi:AAA family ATPase [Bacillus sp. FJAT-27445]|uniref:AAA family ATPase n=1 Tax=Bacillus sp. FJAT-27445 TaxID=1679166 RepID=UPI000744232C|nr:AAA family ATPase [Bacillus sp. FJAT-27445]